VRTISIAIALAILIGADIWVGLTLWNAVTRGEGHGGVFWTAIGMIAILFVALIWATRRLMRRLRASFSTRFAKPS
jgi:hypothetical protein